MSILSPSLIASLSQVLYDCGRPVTVDDSAREAQDSEQDKPTNRGHVTYTGVRC